MPRPIYDAGIINDLRRRVIEHNEAGGVPVKLGELKKIYGNNFLGENPKTSAFNSVDTYLGSRSAMELDQIELFESELPQEPQSDCSGG
jgi:hypothetical protein